MRFDGTRAAPNRSRSRQGADQVRGPSDDQLAAMGVRVVPPAVVRRGAFVARNVVLMPSFRTRRLRRRRHDGRRVGDRRIVRADRKERAPVGRRGHRRRAEPSQANPTIIEDNCFIGARSEVVEGVVVEANSVLGMGVFIGQSTKIFNRATGEVSYGRVPAGSVVVAGSLPSGEGRCHLYCAVIVKQVDAGTRAQTSINELLRA
jgi:2,3,4,5-tetrahydropyridine-2-carboxylate N-succinyltransferase